MNTQITSMVAALALWQMTAPIEPTQSVGSAVQTLTFDADRAVPVAVEPGFAAVIELAPDEEVSSVVVGNSAAWQVTSSQRGDRVVVKPLSGATMTNMVIVTDVRRYLFLLQPAQGNSSAFVYRFVYPNSAPLELTATSFIAQYKFRGTKDLFPLTMRDDGARTTVTWDPKTPLPAIFALDKSGHEAIVNGRMVDGDYVIEGTSTRFVFRQGRAHATATRRTMKTR